MVLRPVQLHAKTEDAACMVPAAFANSGRYGELKLPGMLIAGAEDEIVDPAAHLARLHCGWPQSKLHVMTDTGPEGFYKIPNR